MSQLQHIDDSEYIANSEKFTVSEIKMFETARIWLKKRVNTTLSNYHIAQ